MIPFATLSGVCFFFDGERGRLHMPYAMPIYSRRFYVYVFSRCRRLVMPVLARLLHSTRLDMHAGQRPVDPLTTMTLLDDVCSNWGPRC